jgi:hypothetical protein
MESQPTRMVIPSTTPATVASEGTPTAIAGRVLSSVSRALDSVSPDFASVTLWNMTVTQRVAFTDSAERPGLFMEGLRAIYNEAQVRVIEKKLVKEVQSEFQLSQTTQSFPDAVRAAMLS